MQSDEMTSWIAFAGLACFHTRMIGGGNNQSTKVPPKSVFVNDNTVLGKYNVRKGYQKYGASAYFDADANLCAIYTCFDDEMRYPDNIEWEHAKWVWKCSAFALATIVDHLGRTHLIESNTLTYSTRKHLPPSHPLRALSKMFTFRSVNVNYTAFMTLFPRRGYIERAWAFESDSLQDLLSELKDKYTFKTLPDNRHPSMVNLDPSIYPVNADMVAYWNIMRKFVRDYFSSIYDGSEENMFDDEMLLNCLDEIAARLKLQRKEDLFHFDQVVNLFATLFCTATAYHEHVGHISDYVADPSFVGLTLRDGVEIDAIPNHLLIVALTCGTGLRTPKLLENWEHLFQRDNFSSATIPILKRFQRDLINLSKETERANSSRRFKLETFNPIKMDSSVSV